MKTTNLQLLLFSTVLILIANCGLNIGGGPDPDPDPVTEIIGFTFFPNDTVSVGDTLTIKCIIKDSLRTDLRFVWQVGIHAAQASEKNNITFVVKEANGIQKGLMGVSPTQGAEDRVEQSFQFVVKEN